MKAQRLTGWLRRVFPGYEPYAFACNDRRRDQREGIPNQHLIHMRWFVHELPRLVCWCRVFGHRPVVDGTGMQRVGSYVGQSYLWVRCGRCGERGKPQGSLDPHAWRIGQRYTGDWDMRSGREKDQTMAAQKRGDLPRPLLELPGPIGSHIAGKIGGELVVGGAYPGWEIQFKVGNRWSEHTLAAHLKLGRLGAVYLHTEGIGLGLINWLNRWAETSKLVGVHFGDGRAGWWLWAHRWKGYEDDITQPWWRQTEVDLRLWDKLWGPKRYSYTDIDLNDGEPVIRVVRMPERDYLVRLRLQRCELGRRRQLRRPKTSWVVEWDTLGAGIPFRTGNSWKGDDYTGGGVDVSDMSVRKGTWPSEACAAIALKMTKDRARYSYDPIAALPLNPDREPV